MTIPNLTQKEKYDFLNKHLRHRLTLLRTLRERKNNGHNYQTQGDIYRCVKDSNLIAVRLILDFLGLKGKLENGNYELAPNTKRFPGDIKIDQFIGRLIVPNDVPQFSQRILAGVYVRADKELAHLTSTLNEEFNQENVLINSAIIIEDLLRKYLYEPMSEQFPNIDV